MILGMRIYGLLAGQQDGKDVKKGFDFHKVTVLFENGKKHAFKNFGSTVGLEHLNFGDKITMDVDTPEQTTFGEMASHGDCTWNCAGLRHVNDGKVMHKTAETKL